VRERPLFSYANQIGVLVKLSYHESGERRNLYKPHLNTLHCLLVISYPQLFITPPKIMWKGFYCSAKSSLSSDEIEQIALVHMEK